MATLPVAQAVVGHGGCLWCIDRPCPRSTPWTSTPWLPTASLTRVPAAREALRQKGSEWLAAADRRRLRIPVATVIDMIADGMAPADIIDALPDLQMEDIGQALHYAAESVREREIPIRVAS